jgi:acyl-CoA synthetase (AMP-forming)/AMP-acid ligase II
MLVHTLATLTAPLHRHPAEPDVVWSTFYDVRSYGGLQILLRAVCGRRSLVLPGPSEALAKFLRRLGSLAVTHISGTPSHWRRALMSASAGAISPRYVRLSGEIADQAILDTLAAFYPQAKISHAFASTEAGVGFEVTDGLEGFPARLTGVNGDVEVRIEDGTLRLRSPRIALGYLGGDSPVLRDAEGFVDTSDLVERRGDRCYFLGRKSGVINIGGLKVYPEEVEAVINRHPAVRMSLVHARRSSITGSLVVADVVLAEDRGRSASSDRAADVNRDIMQICRRDLAAHKVPVTIRFVPALEVAAAGKLVRPHA